MLERAHETLYRHPGIYSHKFNQAGLSYQLIIATCDQQLVDIAGPYDAAMHDMTIFRQSGVMDLIPPGKRGLGDSHYSGEPDIMSVKNSSDEPEVAIFKLRALARHETFNKRIKDFAGINSPSITSTKLFFIAVCVIMQN